MTVKKHPKQHSKNHVYDRTRTRDHFSSIGLYIYTLRRLSASGCIMASTDSVPAASSASATACPAAPASGHAPGSGRAPKKKTRKEKRETDPRRRPSHQELSASLNKVLQNDSDVMAVAVKTGSIVGGTNACTIVSKMIEDLPKTYIWKPTVPPCLAGWIPTQNDT